MWLVWSAIPILYLEVWWMKRGLKGLSIRGFDPIKVIHALRSIDKKEANPNE